MTKASRYSPCNVYKLGPKSSHTLYTIQKILQTLLQVIENSCQLVSKKNYLCSPRREVLERPPYFVIFERLLDFLTDFHQG